MANVSVLSPLGDNSHECGYCHSRTESSTSFGVWAHALTCHDYQRLINRGWRRSGSYIYKPYMAKTCCPQYAIRLCVADFHPGKQHRQAMNKFARYLAGTWVPPSFSNGDTDHANGELTPSHDAIMAESAPAPPPFPKNPKAMQMASLEEVDNRKNSPQTKQVTEPSAKKLKNAPFDLEAAAQKLIDPPNGTPRVHRLRTVLEPASFNEEKFNMYKCYQMRVHGDPESKMTRNSFARFLVKGPLMCNETIDRSDSFLTGLNGVSAIGPLFGQFHLNYYLDNKLVGVSVIDLLPDGVSGVYFFYDPDFAWLSLGKISALFEICVTIHERRRHLARRGEDACQYYCMGYYVHTCSKMMYKAQFKPSLLLDPVHYKWVPFSEVSPKLDAAVRNGDSSYTTFLDAPAKLGCPPGDRLLKPNEESSFLIYDGLKVVRMAEAGLDQDKVEFVLEFASKLDPEMAQSIIYAP